MIITILRKANFILSTTKMKNLVIHLFIIYSYITALDPAQ